MLNDPKTPRSHKPQIIILISIIFLTYSPSLFNGFVNWDDDVHVTENQFIQTLDLDHAIDIFTSTVNSTYIPLTSLTFAIEHHFFGHNPFIYHFNNLLLHIIVTVMVFIFAFYCGLSSRASLIGAIIFGLHPMHVESVAWITERKDVLYATFYMLSILTYCRYLQIINSTRPHSKATRVFLLVILLAILSVLAKPMALSLPLILLLIDWYFKRKFCARLVLEKIYIIALYVPIVWVTYFLNARPIGEYPLRSILIWLWCLVFYLRKFFVLDYFVLFYKLPSPVTLNNFSYLSTALMFAILIGVLLYFCKRRLFIFSFLFYFLSIFFVLRFDASADGNIVADRFMYLSSVGLCLFLGYAGNQLLSICENSKTLRAFSRALCLIMFSVLIISTVNQIGVWNSGVTLWNHQLSVEPRVVPALSYMKLAQAYTTEGDFDVNDQQKIEKVEGLYKKALAIKPDYANVYYELGKLYFQKREYGRAEGHLNKAIDLERDHFEAYFSIGKLYYKTERAEKGLKAFVRAIGINPENERIYQNITRFYLGDSKHSQDHSIFQNKYHAPVGLYKR